MKLTSPIENELKKLRTDIGKHKYYFDQVQNILMDFKFEIQKAIINFSFLVTNESENIGMHIRKIAISGVDL